MNITAKQAKEIASSVEVICYEAKMQEIEKKILDSAHDYNFETSVRLTGHDFTMRKEDICRIKKELRVNGFESRFDDWSGFIDIYW